MNVLNSTKYLNSQTYLTKGAHQSGSSLKHCLRKLVLLCCIAAPIFTACSPRGQQSSSDTLNSTPIAPPSPAIAVAAVTPNLVETPVPTPHPATGATEAAIKLFPELAKKDSMFNRAFRDLYEERKKRDIESLTKADWPLVLARQTETMLGIAEKFPSNESVAVSSITPTWIEQRKNQPSALDKPAYDQRRVIGSRYYYPNSYGRYTIDSSGRRVYY